MSRAIGRVAKGVAILCVLTPGVGCGDDGATGATDAAASDAPSPDAFALPPGFGPPIELPLLPDYNHSSETTVAAHGDDVVIVSINQRYVSADSFDMGNPMEGDEWRRVAFYVSHDRGQTYQPPFHLELPETTDPVVRVTQDGTFWATVLLAWDPQFALARSDDGGDTWTPVRVDLGMNDKPWLAVDSSESTLYVAGFSAYYKLGFDGSVLAQVAAQDGMTGAWADNGAAYFLREGMWTTAWNGQGAAEVIDQMPLGDNPRVMTQVSGSIGVGDDGRQWVLHAMRSTGSAPVMVRVRQLPNEGSDLPLTADGAVAFMPAGALDEQGRLHAIWYDSSGTTGKLMYSHSVTDDLGGSYTPPVVVDPNACPGDGWYPYLNSDPPPKPDEPGGRRLREYIDITAGAGRAHLVWTHAPGPPSRVNTTYVDYD